MRRNLAKTCEAVNRNFTETGIRTIFRIQGARVILSANYDHNEDWEARRTWIERACSAWCRESGHESHDKFSAGTQGVTTRESVRWGLQDSELQNEHRSGKRDCNQCNQKISVPW